MNLYNTVTNLVSHLIVKCPSCATTFTIHDIEIMQEHSLEDGKKKVDRIGFVCSKCKSRMYIVENINS